MALTTSTIKWLSLRVKLICVLVFVAGSIMPPYIPRTALAYREVAIATPQFLLVEEGFIMKSASLTRQGSRRAYAEGIIHTVKKGESIERLAGRYGVKADTIRWANDLGEEDLIQPEDDLLILPVDGVLHTVSRGQTLTAIVELYDVLQEEIINQNKIKGGFLLAGQELIIPGGRPIVGKPKIVATAQPPPPSGEPEPVQPKEPVEIAKKPEDIPKPSKAPEEKPTPKFTSEPTGGVLQKPCRAVCFFTQYYHPGHYAVDLQERGGGPIYAAEAGTVIRSDYGWNGGYGNVIEIDHGNDLITLYAHNKEHYVEEGHTVKRGQLIAWMGHTGLVYGSTGIHVHFEVRVRGIKKNPLLYIQ